MRSDPPLLVRVGKGAAENAGQTKYAASKAGVIGYKISSAWVLVTFVAKSGFMKPK
jgi:hypothetical protein